jgi:hypothetical protein
MLDTNQKLSLFKSTVSKFIKFLNKFLKVFEKKRKKAKNKYKFHQKIRFKSNRIEHWSIKLIVNKLINDQLK